jgi:hypothetical protein
MTRLGCRRKRTVVGHSRKVRLLATTGSNLLEDPAVVAGVLTGLLRCCHGKLLVNGSCSRIIESQIERGGLESAFYALVGGIASPGNGSSAKPPLDWYSLGGFFFWHSLRATAKPKCTTAGQVWEPKFQNHLFPIWELMIDFVP